MTRLLQKDRISRMEVEDVNGCSLAVRQMGTIQPGRRRLGGSANVPSNYVRVVALIALLFEVAIFCHDTGIDAFSLLH